MAVIAMPIKDIQLSENPLDVGAAFEAVQTPAAGGVAIFAGTTRQWTDGRETARLDYESYGPMALKEMHRLADEAAARWPVEKLCLWHRLGAVPPAEPSVVIAVATPHRAAAFDACRFLIDALKEQVPIWKREVYADGQTEWVEGGPPATAPPPEGQS